MSTTPRVPIIPLNTKMLVQPNKAEERSKGGIILPGQAQEKPREGVVLAVGPGKRLEDGSRLPIEVKIGDRVIYRQYGGHPVKDGEIEYMIVDESELVGVRAN